MATNKPRILLTVDEELIERIDDYRRTQKKIPPRSEAIRRLLDEALKKQERKTKK